MRVIVYSSLFFCIFSLQSFAGKLETNSHSHLSLLRKNETVSIICSGKLGKMSDCRIVRLHSNTAVEQSSVSADIAENLFSRVGEIAFGKTMSSDHVFLSVKNGKQKQSGYVTYHGLVSTLEALVLHKLNRKRNPEKHAWHLVPKSSGRAPASTESDIEHSAAVLSTFPSLTDPSCYVAPDQAAVNNDFCNKPYEAVCSGPNTRLYYDEQLKLRDESLKNEPQKDFVKWINDEFVPSYNVFNRAKPDDANYLDLQKEFEANYKIYASWLKNYTSFLFDKLQKKTGYTRKQLEDSFIELRKNAAARVRSQGMGGRVEIEAKEIESIKLSLPDVYAGLPAKPSSIKNFISQCGLDGGSGHLAFSDLSNEVIICPGHFFSFLNGTNAEGFISGVAHEFGHYTDTSCFALKDKNNDVLDCFKTNYSSKLFTVNQVADHWKNAAVDMQKRIDELKQDKADADVINYYIDTLETLENWRNRQNRITQNRNDAIKSHADELLADSFSNLVLAENLKKTTSDTTGNRNRVRSALSGFCSEGGSAETQEVKKIIWGNLGNGEDGVHPSDRFRIENALRSPSIRKALGCSDKPLNANEPFCGVDP